MIFKKKNQQVLAFQKEETASISFLKILDAASISFFKKKKQQVFAFQKEAGTASISFSKKIETARISFSKSRNSKH